MLELLGRLDAATSDDTVNPVNAASPANALNPTNTADGGGPGDPPLGTADAELRESASAIVLVDDAAYV